MPFAVVKMTTPPTICASYLRELPNPLHLPHTMDQTVKDPVAGYEAVHPASDGAGGLWQVGYRIVEVEAPEGFDYEQNHQFIVDADGKVTLHQPPPAPATDDIKF